ncbi:MAG: hypothetical protein J5525_05660 [Lachnospiraceae bacterium]|nr:hypothetical protein [Lachnospiraceae bacterium]
MISRRYKTIFDFSNCMLIYLLGLGASLGITALVRYEKFSWQYTLVSAIILFAYTMIRLFVNQLPVSFIAHIVIAAVAFYIPYGAAIHKYMIAGFAILLIVIDMNDFYKKKNQSYGVIHVASCSVFLLIFAYVDYAANKVREVEGNMKLGVKYELFATFVCLICIAFFAFILIRAYVANAIKLADNSQIDENAPVDYMYGNSNRFVGPIIALIIAAMLVIQSRTSENIFANMWMGLLKGVAGVFNLFSFVQSSQTEFDAKTKIAAPGTTLYYVEFGVALIIMILLIAAVVAIITRIYKSHWHKDISADETLESAAMVEKREWIYHKESKKMDDTAVTKAAEIPTDIAEMEEEKPAEAKEVAEEKVAEVKEAVEEKVTEVKEAVEEKKEEVKEAAEEKTEVVKDKLEEAKEALVEKAAEAKAAVEEKAEAAKEEVKVQAEDTAKEAADEAKAVVEEKADAVKEKAPEASKNHSKQQSSGNKKK